MTAQAQKTPEHLRRIAARESAGYTIDEAAKRFRISPSYLKTIERYGGVGRKRAQQMARAYKCSILLFTTSTPAKSPRIKSQWRLRRIEARESAGLTPEQVAKKARICVAYYNQIERNGCDSPILAEQLGRILGCRLDIYVYR